MKCSLLLALAFRAQSGQGFVGPTGGLVLSNCVSVAARSNNNIVRRGVASTSLKAAASDEGSDASVNLRKPAVVEAIAERSNLDKNQAEAALAAFTDVVMQEVADGNKISLQGFGTFEGRARKGRTGRNPRTGEELKIKATTAPAFSASKAFKDMVKAAHTD
ncbi:DNA-binding protein HU [Ectocarpus siliculosus]|uniref:DNA-binding protein HU n=1 Tax=Ectocarpus siliculosus TaxID=2880 RepID=D8LST5_ECTSI|nr:DNA-binding protein HU [Ectocarpus siliculosus]|eukprot:CBN75285.1 DNA-binding protein HU [Ectocarpus siliculosus]